MKPLDGDAPSRDAEWGDQDTQHARNAADLAVRTLKDDLAQFFVEQQVDSVMFSIDSVTKETLKKIRGIDKLAKIEADAAAPTRILTVRGVGYRFGG